MIKIMILLIICMLIGKSLALPTIATTPSQNDETDGEASRKILGSSVVTSVSVITDHGNGSKTYYSDAVGKPLPKPFVGSQLASPINLLNPDRYEFYTFDDNGDLVKRLMTLDEIQSIIASGDGDTSYNSNFWAPGEPEKRVEDVVNNVQNVLKEEIQAHKDTEKKPVLVSPQITSNWNLILPPIFSNLAETTANNSFINTSTEKIPTDSDLYSAKTETPEAPVITVEVTNPEQNVTKEGLANVATTSAESEKYEPVQLTTWVPTFSPTVFVPSSPSPFTIVSELGPGSTLNQFTSTAPPLTFETFSTTYYNKQTTEQEPTTQYGELSTFFYVNHDKQPQQESTAGTSYSYLDLTTGTYKTSYYSPSAKTETVPETSTANVETTANFRTERPTTSDDSQEDKAILTTVEDVRPTTQNDHQDKLEVSFTPQEVQPTTQTVPQEKEELISTAEDVKPTTQNSPQDKLELSSTPQDIQPTIQLVSQNEQELASTAQDVKHISESQTELPSTSPVTTQDDLQYLASTLQEHKTTTENVPTVTEEKQQFESTVQDIQTSPELAEEKQASTIQEIRTADQEAESTITLSRFSTTPQPAASTTDELLVDSTTFAATVESDKVPERFSTTQKSIEDMAVTQLLNQLLHSTNAYEINNQLLSDTTTKFESFTTENQKYVPTTFQQTKSDDELELISTSNTKRVTNGQTTDSPRETTVEYTTTALPDTLGQEEVNLAVDSLLSQVISQYPTTIENDAVRTTPNAQSDATTAKEETVYELLVKNNAEPTTSKLTTVIDSTTSNYKTRYDEIDLEQPLSTVNVEEKPEASTTLGRESTTQETEEAEEPSEVPTTVQDIATPSKVDSTQTAQASDIQNDGPASVNQQTETSTQLPITVSEEESTTFLKRTTNLNNADNYKKIPQEVLEPLLTTSTESNESSDYTSTQQIELMSTTSRDSPNPTTVVVASTKPEDQTTESLPEELESSTVPVEAPTTVLTVQPDDTSKAATTALPSQPLTEIPSATLDQVDESSTTETNDLFVTVPIFTTSPKVSKQPEFKIILNTTASTSTQPPETTWTLVSTVLPHKTEVEQLKIQAQNHSIPTSVDLVPRPLQGYGLEDSTSGLDTDVFQFTELCNELAFSFWSSVTTGISFARSVVVSPFAMTSMLAMVFLGARGSTSGEMNDILKLDEMVTFNPHAIFRSVVESIEVSKKSGVAVSVFARELYSDKNKGKLLGFYKERVKQFYDGHVEEVNFKEINDVVRKRTNLLVKRYTWGKISEFLKDSNLFVRPPLAAVSANIFQTDCSQASIEGRDGELHFVVLPSIRQRKLIPIPAVVWRSGFLAGYDPGLDATAVAIGTKDSTISTIFVIPGQQGISAPGDGLMRLENRLVENAYKQNAWNRLLRSLIPRPGLEVQIPRFSHKSIINATAALQRMGLKDLFNSRDADLKGLNGAAHEFYLSDVVQVNTFATCGEGKISESHHSEIYPATTNRSFRRIRKIHPRPVDNNDNLEEPRDYQRAFHDPLFDPSYLALPLQLRPRQARLPEAPRLRFDRPFLYFVRHNPTGLILHMGRFNPRLLP